MPASTIENLAGRSYGQIQIGAITSSTPRKYAAKCLRCGSSWDEAHDHIQTLLASSLPVPCRNSACRKGVLNIETNAKSWHQEDARRERVKAQREADALAAKKAKELALELESNAKKLAMLERERVASGRDDFQVDSAVRNARMTQEAADKFNAEQSLIFAEQTSSYYPCDANQDTLVSYLVRNGCQIANAATWKKAFERLNSLGLMEPWPEPQEPIHADPDPLPSSHEGYAQPKPKPQQRYDGYDENGEPCSYSEYQVRNMSSEQLRRHFHIPTLRP